MEDTEAWSIYIKDQYQSILLYNTDKAIIETGLAVPTSDHHPKIWGKEDKASYVSFVLKVDYSNPTVDNFYSHLNHLENLGYRVSNIIARYLFSACDDKYYDYYKAFAEVY